MTEMISRDSRPSYCSTNQSLVVSHRSWSCLDLQRHLSDINGVNAFSLSNYDTLRGILSYARLPLLLVDNILNEEQIALEAHLPTVHFMRPHVGGVLFDGGISQAESLFSKYPDLISIIPSYQNLSDGESLWIDHYRGPFLPETLGAFTAVDRFTEEAVKWRRLVLLNSNQYPTWMSEIHYSTQCLINEIIFVTAGLSPDGLKSKDEVVKHIT
ncbi:unnamed protein product [Trichobilharzia regenti]|nr:unnamed protein product [Trichobilharzia regenti]